MLACATSKPTDGLTSGCERCSSHSPPTISGSLAAHQRLFAQTFIDYEPEFTFPIADAKRHHGNQYPTHLQPVKQGMDHDPEATFIRQWVPEIARLSTPEIHDWGTNNFLRPTADYPHPIVDHAEAVRLARQRFREIRTNANYKSESERVRQLHGSRKRATNRPRKPARRKNERDSTSKTRHQVGNVR